jgi:hypothetical protein
VEEYRKAGKVARNVEGHLTLPGGAWLPWTATGKTLVEKFDHYHMENPRQVRAPGIVQSVNMFDTVETLANAEVIDEEEEENEIDDLARVFANEAAKRFDRSK